MNLLLFLFLLLTPRYNTTTPPPALAPGGLVKVWNAETPTTGGSGAANASASQQVRITQNPGASNALAVDGTFSGAPGAFEIDLQVAQVDSDANYVTVGPGGAITAVNSNNSFHLDAPYVDALYARLLLVTRTNSVTVTATIKR